MIGYARVSEICSYINRGALWADWELGTRCWEYPWTIEHGDFKPGLKVLDAGCGQGPLLFALAELGCEAHGVDLIEGEDATSERGYGIPKDWLEKQGGRVHYHHGNLHSLPFPDEAFDRVTCISVLEHILSPQDPRAHNGVLLELKRVLRQGGLLVITVDYFLNETIVPGYDYRDDIRLLEMRLKNPASSMLGRDEIAADEDTYVIPPKMYLNQGYGRGFNKTLYHRLTSIGYVLRKE